MTFTDPIGDMFSRIRNGQMRSLNSVLIPSSNFRKNILENSRKTLSWKLSPISEDKNFSGYGNCFFENEDSEIVGVHYVAGSHVRWNSNTRLEIENLLDGEY